MSAHLACTHTTIMVKDSLKSNLCTIVICLICFTRLKHAFELVHSLARKLACNPLVPLAKKNILKHKTILENACYPDS